jgi:hypothetical protein
MDSRKIAFHVLHTNEQFTVSLCEAAPRKSWDLRPPIVFDWARESSFDPGHDNSPDTGSDVCLAGLAV